MSGRKDQYYYRAKKENYRSRAAFKLAELQDKFSVIGSHDCILELGSSPGGWSQVIKENTDGPVLSVDRSPQDDIEGIRFLRGDIFSQRVVDEISVFLRENGRGCFERILSDTMAKTSGISHRDHALSVELGERAMEIAGMFLCDGGSVLMKQFQGDMTQDFLRKHKPSFKESRITSTKATRGGSSEVFLLFRDFHRNKE